MNQLVICVFALCLMSCQSRQHMLSSADQNQRKQLVDNQLNDWHRAAAGANFQAYFDAMANDAVFIGTDASEVWTKQEFMAFAKPYFDAGDAWDFTAKARHIYLSEFGDIAWFDELLDTWMGECRGSGVLSWNDDIQDYQIEQYVLSLTIPNDSIKEVMEITLPEK